jgi:hypothetical protein
VRLYTQATLQIRCNYDAIWWRSTAIQERPGISGSALNHLSHLFCDAKYTPTAKFALQNLQKAAFAGGEG